MDTKGRRPGETYERLLDRVTSEDDIQRVYRKFKEAGYGRPKRPTGQVARNDRRKGEKDRRTTEGPGLSQKRATDGPAAGRRSADHFPPVDPRLRRKVNRWAASERLLITGPRERWYDFISHFRPSTPDLVSARLLEAIAPQSGYLSGNPYTFTLATTMSAIRALSRVLLGVPQKPTGESQPRRAGAATTTPDEPGARLFATLRRRDPFALEFLSRLARENPELTESLQFLNLSLQKRSPVRVEQLARITRDTYALYLSVEQITSEVLTGLLAAVRETAQNVGYTGQRGVTVDDACDILRVCVENLERFAGELYPVLLKAIGRFSPRDEVGEEKTAAMRSFAGITESDVLSREAFQEALRRRKEEERARQAQIELETVKRSEEAGIGAAFGATLRILGSMFPDSGLERIEQNPYLLPYFDNRVFARDLPFDHGTHTVEHIARHDPLQIILVLHRILDNLLTGVTPITLESLIDRHGIAESFAQITSDWTTAYDSLLVPYIRAINEYEQELANTPAASGENPALKRITEEIAQLRNRAIKGYGETATERGAEGLRLWSLAERLTLLLDIVGEEINPDVAKRDDPVAKRIYRAIGMDPVFSFAEGGDGRTSVQRPVIRQLRRYVEAKYHSGIASVPRVAQLFAIDFLRALAELYRFLLNDERSPLRSAGSAVLVAGEEEAQTWQSERSSRSGAIDDRLRIRLDEHAETSFADPLTGLRNKEFFLRKLPERFAALVKAGSPISVLMVDIDHFKWVNDSLGHQTGDLVLKDATSTIADGVRRGNDIAIRYGGEEIVIVSPAPLHSAAALGERLRSAQRDHVETRDLYEQIREIGRERDESCGSFSIGVVARREGESLEQCIERADKALYAAKRSRDLVVIGRAAAKSDGSQALLHESFSDYVARLRNATEKR